MRNGGGEGVKCEKDKKEQCRGRERMEERESNRKERGGWTKTRETTKPVAVLNCLCGSYHFIFISS